MQRLVERRRRHPCSRRLHRAPKPADRMVAAKLLRACRRWRQRRQLGTHLLRGCVAVTGLLFLSDWFRRPGSRQPPAAALPLPLRHVVVASTSAAVSSASRSLSRATEGADAATSCGRSSCAALQLGRVLHGRAGATRGALPGRARHRSASSRDRCSGSRSVAVIPTATDLDQPSASPRRRERGGVRQALRRPARARRTRRTPRGA